MYDYLECESSKAITNIHPWRKGIIFLDVCDLYSKAAYILYIFLSVVQIQFLRKCLVNLNFVATFETKGMLCTSNYMHAEYL